MIPEALRNLLAQKANEGASCRIELNVKDGRVISLAVTETIRIDRGDPREPAGKVAGGSGGAIS